MKKVISTALLAMVLSGSLMAGDKDNGMTHGQMMEMHESAAVMQQQMTDIENEKDPEKRQALMQDHMDSMKQYMSMMHENMSSDQKIEAMQVMMEQMLERDDAARSRPIHNHQKSKK
jgi:hypothetical protein